MMIAIVIISKLITFLLQVLKNDLKEKKLNKTMEDIKKVYSIHFPEKQVYVNSTCYSLEEKMKKLKMIQIISYTVFLKFIQIQKFEKVILILLV